MEKSYFSLELHRSNRLTRIFQLAFGILCFGVALIWLVLNFSSMKSNVSLWITILFLAGFGYYQVIAGLGKSEKYIEITDSSIKVKEEHIIPCTGVECGRNRQNRSISAECCFLHEIGQDCIPEVWNYFYRCN